MAVNFNVMLGVVALSGHDPKPFGPLVPGVQRVPPTSATFAEFVEREGLTIGHPDLKVPEPDTQIKVASASFLEEV